ncbi:hypothetical protein BpHYR1_006149 [Brachionus plicatilis]|uniref:Uncharacterized protein n=1 Tax=Brachionus plicatilis TaxID=10195 RepID=A0A3M7RVT9_BRAPC|nr:hypothetical protein BpHYR1_006149 [Brachionus plicatilis]
MQNSDNSSVFEQEIILCIHVEYALQDVLKGLSILLFPFLIFFNNVHGIYYLSLIHQSFDLII